MAAVMRDVSREMPDYASRSLDPELVPVHERLMDWGDWSRDYYDKLPGMAGREVLHRIMREGPWGASGDLPPPVAMPWRIEQVEVAVVSIRGVRKRMLKTVYLYCSDWPSEAQRGLYRMKQRKWDLRLHSARVLVGHMLGYEL